jgi:signal transduction histidine kinase
VDRDKGLPLRGLRIQIILWIVMPVTLLLIGIAFTGVYGHERAMQDLVEERDQALAQVAANQVADRLRQRASALQALAVEQPFHHPGQSAQQARLAQAGTLDGLFVAPIALLGQDGTPLPGVGPLPVWTGDPHLAALAERTLQTGRLEMSPLFNAAWGQDVFLLAVPVQAGGTVHGLLAAPVALPDLGLEAVLAQVQAGQQGAAYVVDASGAVLARYPAGRARQSLDGHTGLAIALQEPAAGATLCDAPDGERMVLGYALVPAAVHGAPDTGWRVLVEEPWQAVTSPVLRYSQVMPAVAVLGVVVSLLALYYGVRSIVRPLQLLGSRAERLAWGEFEAIDEPVGGVEEIEELRRTLDQMAHRIESQQRGMHDYIAAITLGQEEERKRLARELHDDTAQALIALGQQVEMAQNLLSNDPQRAAQRLAEVRSLLAQALEGIRRFSRDLRPVYLEDLGFIPALESLARLEPREPAGEPAGAPQVHFSVTGQVRRLPPDLELAAYRIVQEALNNALQHARASQVRVQVQFEPEHLVLSVRDDGRGFVPPALPDALPRQGHFGLMGIQERALLYGGQLALHAAPGQGTEVQVRLPYPAGAGTSPEQGRSAQGRE